MPPMVRRAGFLLISLLPVLALCAVSPVLRSSHPVVAELAELAAKLGLIGIVAWTAVNQQSSLMRILDAPPVAYIGRISYCVYLIHPGIVDWWRHLYDHGHGGSSGIVDVFSSAGSFLGCYVLTLLIAHLSWRYFESRILTYRNRFFAIPRGDERASALPP